MYKLLPLLGDIGLGILLILFVSSCYGQHDAGVFFLLPLALLPDLDAIPELMKRGKVAASAENPYDHRELLHKPVLWLLATGIWWYFSGFYGAVAFALVLGHFLHDSVLTGWGVSWLWPISDTRIKFFVNEANQESFALKDWIRTWDAANLNRAIVAHGDENWIEHLYLRPTIVSIVEYSLFASAIMALLLR